MKLLDTVCLNVDIPGVKAGQAGTITYGPVYSPLPENPGEFWEVRFVGITHVIPEAWLRLHENSNDVHRPFAAFEAAWKEMMDEP